MSLLRRLALGLLTVVLLAGAAVAAGYAMRVQSGTGAHSTGLETGAAAYDDPTPAPESSPRPRPAPAAPHRRSPWS